MAKNVSLIGILVIVLVFGMAVVGCDSDQTNGNGNENGNGNSSDQLTGTRWVGGTDTIKFLAGKKVEFTRPSLPDIVNGTYTITGNDVNVNFKGHSSSLNISYDEIWVYEIDGSTLTVKSATGNPNLAMGGANVGFKMYKQNN